MAKSKKLGKGRKLGTRTKETSRDGDRNPNGANQFFLDPRQKLCWEMYIDHESESFGNAYRSAVRAGYSHGTAKQITVAEWFLEKTRKMNMMGKVEKVFNKTLDYQTDSVSEKGETKVHVDLLRVQNDTAKFIAERLGKNDGYSTRTEITGKGGKDLIPETPVLGGKSKE